jgi:hypothetical protein
MIRTLLALGSFLVATATVATAQTPATLTGKVVDVATYVTRDHNMDSMMKSSPAMPGGHEMAASTTGNHMMPGASPAAMSNDHAMSASMPDNHGMNDTTKEECRMLGLLANGHITLLSSQMGSDVAARLCGKLNKTIVITGKSYSQSGTTVFLVDKLP